MKFSLSARKATGVSLSLATAAALAALLCAPARSMQRVLEGVSLWAVNVLPAALPFLFLTGLLAQTPLFSRLARLAAPPCTRLFGVSGAGGCAALLSLLSGYPAGAKTVERLCGQGAIAEEERLRVACLASTSGPAFLVGAAGCAMAGSAACGWLLFASHVCGVFGVSFLLGRNKRRPAPFYGAAQRCDLPEALSSAVLSVLTVGGAVTLFYLFGCMLCDLLAPLALPEEVLALLVGGLEMTAGCARLLSEPSPLRLALCAFLVTFGGMCVLVQQWNFLAKTGIPFGKFLLVKLCQGVLAGGCCFALAALLFA